MQEELKEQLKEWAGKYNDPAYFSEDPICFPREFVRRGASRQDIEIAAVLSAHLAWGKRKMIVRDCTRLFDEMNWAPLDYVLSADYRNDQTSLHRTVKWSEIAQILSRLRGLYLQTDSLEDLSAGEMRTMVYGQKDDPKAANKKINMLRRWMVRNDGIVDLGIWSSTSPKDLIMPLDIHVYTQAYSLGLTQRKSKDIITAKEITEQFKQIWPDDPLLGDFALFGVGVTKNA